MNKDFTEWTKLKTTLDDKLASPPFFKEGEIWWCSVGLNIGIEIDGKDDLFLRPILIVKKLSKDSFIGCPFTKQHKKGSWYVLVSIKNEIQIVNISQIRAFDCRRMVYRQTELRKEDFRSVKNSLKHLLNL